MLKHVGRQHALHETNHLRLRHIGRLIAGDQIAEPIELYRTTDLTNGLENITQHQQELRHRHKIEHLRMNGNEN
ncbi:hypothetical protein D9M70_589730 [compost metagenome]